MNNTKQSILTAVFTGVTNAVSFGLSAGLAKVVGKAPTGNIFQKMLKSLSTEFTPGYSWFMQGLYGNTSGFTNVTAALGCSNARGSTTVTNYYD